MASPVRGHAKRHRAKRWGNRLFHGAGEPDRDQLEAGNLWHAGPAAAPVTSAFVLKWQHISQFDDAKACNLSESSVPVGTSETTEFSL